MENVPELNDAELMAKVDIAAKQTMANEIDILKNGKVRKKLYVSLCQSNTKHHQHRGHSRRPVL